MPDDTNDARARRLLEEIDLGDWSVLIDDTADDLREIYGDGLAEGLRLTDMGVDLDQVNERALDWARERAAALVTLIEDNTRSMIRDEVATAIEEGWGADRLTNELIDSVGFSQERARMISRTELNVANNQGNVEGYRQAAATGVRVLKEFQTAGDDLVEDDCLENEEAGPIELDEEFPNGDMPHPNCRCAIIPYLPDEEEE